MANHFANDAFIIHTDFLQKKAFLRAFPYHHPPHGNGLPTLTRCKDHLDLPTLLYDCLTHRQRAIRSAKMIIAEGLVLSRKWFEDALVCAIQNILAGRTCHVHRYFLFPPAEVMLEQIQTRAREKPARQREALIFPDIPAVQKQRDRHRDTLGPAQDAARWQVHAEASTLHQAIERLLTP
ncbi:hypothetical protein VITFI_CDS0140 [Vitreoscilla filiformis]|uniref:Uncharacterized protein n=1 Tax=Vitreoscilla filiformis TaxID=63 RepID=A0A221KAB6_VITFI|nr:hypothetical protein VITFI_CDS0140 [Vitreoscilla filiformis]